MKIMVVGDKWAGGTLEACVKGLRDLGHDVREMYTPGKEWFHKRLIPTKIMNVKKIEKIIHKHYQDDFNKNIISKTLDFQPDLYFTLNESLTYPDTLTKLKSHLKKCLFSCWIADNPFDSYRFKSLPVSLKHFDYLFVGDTIWKHNVSMIAPKARINQLIGAYDPNIFRSVEVNENDVNVYTAPVAFAGESYGLVAQGCYRASLLSKITDHGLKLWGDPGWREYFSLYPSLKEAYQGRRLTFNELNIMNQSAKIVMNISNPQCTSAFQQRTFEILASGGFQIADDKNDFERLLGKDKVVTFSDVEEMKEKIEYYLSHDVLRSAYILKAREIINNNHTYKHRMQEMLSYLGNDKR